MSVRVAGQDSLSGGTAPRRLFKRPVDRLFSRRPFDVSSDGERFAWIQPGPNESPPTEINIVFNWFEELKRLTPTDD